MPNVNDEYPGQKPPSSKELKQRALENYTKNPKGEPSDKKDFKFPTEIVDLPSRGLLYPEDNPLSQGQIEMKYMTAKEEDILTSQSYIKQGVVLDKLFRFLDADAWKDEEVSGFMLSGLAHYLYANEKDSLNGNEYYDDITNIESNLKDYAFKAGGCQSSCTKDRLHSMPRQSVAWRICKNVMGMSSIDASKFIGMNDEQSEMLNVSGK